MTTANGTNNGRTARKSLADQIDRLDNILDGLDEALHGAITDALKEVVAQVVSQAVQSAVTEVLPPPAPEPKPTLTDKLKSAGSVLCAKAHQGASFAKEKLCQGAALACSAGK